MTDQDFAGIPSDQVPVKRDGVVYGDRGNYPLIEREGLPQSLHTVTHILQKSCMLASQGKLLENTGQVIETYALDIARLHQQIDGFDTFIRELIHFAIVEEPPGPGSDSDLRDNQLKQAQRLWNKLDRHLPKIDWEGAIQFSASLATEPQGTILDKLWKQFCDVLQAVVQRLLLQLKFLVDRGHVGLIERAGSSSWAYHFLVEGRKGTKRLVCHAARVDVQEHVSLEEQSTPQRVMDFWAAVPEPVRRLIDKVESRITMREEVCGKKSGEPATKAVSSTDFALILGDFVIARWNHDDVIAEQDARSIRQNRARLMAGGFIVAVVLLIAVLVGGGVGGVYFYNYTVQQSAAQAAAEKDQYIAYQEAHQQRQVYAARKDQPLYMPIGVRIYFAGPAVERTGVLLLRPGTKGFPTGFELTPIPDQEGTYYGDADLEAEFGVPVTVHVLEYDRNEIRYSVTRNELSLREEQ